MIQLSMNPGTSGRDLKELYFWYLIDVVVQHLDVGASEW